MGFLVEGGLDFPDRVWQRRVGDFWWRIFVEGVELLEELLAEVAGFGGVAGGGEGAAIWWMRDWRSLIGEAISGFRAGERVEGELGDCG